MAWAEIDLGALRHNFRETKKLAFFQLEPRISRELDILSVVKADAYGHGMVEVARAIDKEGGRFFVVSNVNEAIALRDAGCRRRILLLEAALPEIAPALLKHDLTPAVSSLPLARAIGRLMRRTRKKFPVHVKIDTGMGRLGVCQEEGEDFVLALNALEGIRVEGLLTHFPLADSDRQFTERQIDGFTRLVASLIRRQVPFRYIHAANSMGLAGYKNRFFNLVRPGVMLYGLYPLESLRAKVKLRPVMSVRARVLMTKKIRRGQGISYGHIFRAPGDMPVAVLAIGYSDGYSRAFSNRASVLLNGVSCPVVGRVTMDQTIVDITRAGKVSAGDEAVVLGRQGPLEIRAETLAGWADTIHYEVVCNLGNRLPRFYIK